MRKLLLITFIILNHISFIGNGQVFKKADPVICPVDYNSYDTFVPPSTDFSNQQFERSAGQANMIVNYNGFTEEAQEAFQYAVDIWASIIKSPVRIIIDANFIGLGEGVLGQAGPTNFVRDFPEAPQESTFYPIALAEKLARTNLNGENEADISSSFNSDFDFYFGLDGNTPANQYDFVSIVLHELGHGLGFTGGVSFNEEQETGRWSISSGLPTIYTQFVKLGDNSPIIFLPDNSSQAGDAFTGNDLFFDGPFSILELGERPKLFAPGSWNQGSSYSHLDESRYPAGNPNSLMSPQFGAGEAIHDPGVTKEIFADMGWINTYLEHQNNFQITDNSSDPLPIELKIVSDTTFDSESPILVYSTDAFETTDTLNLTDSGDGITYQTSIPNPGQNSIIKYFFAGVLDLSGREYFSPTNAPEDFYEINIVDFSLAEVPYTLIDGGDFESSQEDFQGIALTGGINLWELGTPGNRLNESISGLNVWKTKLTENIGNEDKRLSSALISPIFDFTDESKNHELSFSFIMENAYSEASGVFSSGPFGMNVQFSLDNGATWELLGDVDDDAGTNWYNIAESSSIVFPELASSGWIQQTIEVLDGDTTFIPVEAKYNVSFLTGFEQVNFRIVFYVIEGFNELGYQADGVLIDDFQILKSNPTAEFTVSNSEFIFPGDEIAFEYLSTGATSFVWNFGDGNTSNLENPTHIYTQGGSYDVSLTITSAEGEDTVLKENFITVNNSKSIPYTLEDGGNLEGEVLDFIIENISGTGFELGQSTIEGKAGTASGENAFVTGINVTEYANNSEAYIYTPEFQFEALGDYELAFETNYSFEPTWDGFIVEYTLDRGDSWLKLNDEQVEGWYNQISNPQSVFGNEVPIFSGTTSNEFERKFTDISFLGGQGNVSFRIKFRTDPAETDAGMAIDNFEILGPVSGPAIPDFSSDVQSGCAGINVIFSNESVGSVQSLDWSFGSGAEPTTASGIGPHDVTYDDPGEYSIKLTVTDVNGETAVEEKNAFITIQENHLPTVTVGEADSDGNIILTASDGDAYQWFYRDVIVPDATEQTLVVESTGNYKVAVVINGCEGLSENTIVTSNESPLAQSFSVFPNPLKHNNAFTISFENDFLGEYSVEIYSLSGAQVLTKKFTKVNKREEKSIRFPNAIESLYLVRLTTGNQSTQLKVLVE
ncbi:Por secretion system C-terminal sorting domain-containing protein [Marivirga sericea]|uniref:Por secretion system C-terminal sorting domain-containing protein n=1 Tax=Marivirga sericea TaxID=1028 RepID=A0A1X7KPH9_9BACT|nr:PKD domain-containing protein [Marivirga sericea]SMG43136.1 Por secretion system C-terminal sorting domain-containing protein [Marivirga sericea]